MSTDLRYPIGPFTPAPDGTPGVLARAIAEIAGLPRLMRRTVAGLGEAQLDTPYRPDGWTVRQVVHHVADSHINGFVRLKLALTEHEPTIKPYDEGAWAGLADARLPIDVSLSLLDHVHARWDAVYRSLAPAQFERRFLHPALGEWFTVERHAQLYAWHGRHHAAHIATLRQRQGWGAGRLE